MVAAPTRKLVVNFTGVDHGPTSRSGAFKQCLDGERGTLLEQPG